MDKLQTLLLSFILLFIIIFLIDYIFVKLRYLKNSKKTKKKKNNELMELSYLIHKFKLDKSKLPLSKLVFIISLINAFIMSLVAVVIIFMDTNILIQLLVGFILLFALIYAIYELVGRFLLKRGYGKNGK